MPTKKVIDMTASSSSNLAYNDFVYLTKAVPQTDEKMQASVLRDYALSGIKTSANSGLAQTSSSYASSNPEYELSLDVNNLSVVTPVAGDYISIEDVTDNSTKKVLVSAVVGLASGTVTSVTGGTNLTASPTTGATIVNLDSTLTGLTSVTSTDFVGNLTGDVTGDVTGNADTATALATARNIAGVSFDGTAAIDIPITGLSDVYASMAPADGDVLTYDTTNGWQSETPTTGDITGVTAGSGLSGGGTSGTVTLSLSSPVTVATGGTGQTSYTNGQLLIGNTTGNTLAKSTLTAGSNVTITNGTGTIEIAATDTNTTYSAGDGLDLTGTTFSTDLKTNGGLEIDTTELSVAQGISQYDVAQFDTGVVDDDFLRINGTAVEGRSASEVKTDIGLGNVENTALSTWTGSTNITTLGTVATGTWEGTTVAVDQGGTGQTSYTNGQLLIGNTTGNTLTKATLTAGTNITITEGAGSITIAAAAGGDPAGTAVAMAIALGG